LIRCPNAVVAANATNCFRASAGPKGGIVPQLAGEGARGGVGRCEERQPGAQRVPPLLKAGVSGLSSKPPI